MRYRIPTLGRPPDHWRVERNRALFTVVDDRSVDGSEELLTVSHITGVSKRSEKSSVTMFMAESLDGYKRCRPGDLVINTMWAWMGALGVSDLAGIVSPAYHVYRTREPAFDPGFFNYFYRTPAYITEMTRNSRGVWSSRLRLYPEDFLDMESFVPPPAEQRAIADFLDRKTAAIDALISKKERLLALLAEQRAALIHRAVTRGLDPDVEMKDSGVEWIGEVPAHWEVKRMKFACRLESGHTPSRSEPSYWIEEECTIPWVSLNDTQTLKANDYISDTHYKISERGMANSSARLVDAGAVVFTRDATIGLTAITAKRMAVSQHIIAWVCRPELDNRFLLRVIGGMTRELERLTFGATIKTIGMADVKELVTPLPPSEEQQAIVVWLGDRLEALDRSDQAVRDQLDRLREYRQALITAAVTGQLDLPSEPAA